MRGTNDHGSGCLLAAAIAAGPAKGDGLLEHVTAAEAYVARALAGSATWRLGAKATAPSTTSAGQWEKERLERLTVCSAVHSVPDHLRRPST